MKKLSLFLVALTMVLFSCKPEVEKPTVVTKSVGEVTKTSAKVVGQVAADGGADVTERGVCWSTDGTPTILDFSVKDVEGGLGSYDVVFTDLVPNTQYYVRAYATNEAGTGYGDEKTFVTVDPLEGTTNGHAWVDLGLPSGRKWATCNVGANAPEEYGDYFAWGETSTKETYDVDNCPTYELHIVELQYQGYIDSELNLTAQYDAATANWGGDWRMPTYDELKELYNDCIWTWWTAQNGVDGYKVVGPNGNSIFLPAADCRVGSSLYNTGSPGYYGYYWSSSPYLASSNGAFIIYFNSYFDSYIHDVSRSSRHHGLSVRPVLE